MILKPKNISDEMISKTIDYVETIYGWLLENVFVNSVDEAEFPTSTDQHIAQLLGFMDAWDMCRYATEEDYSKLDWADSRYADVMYSAMLARAGLQHPAKCSK